MTEDTRNTRDLPVLRAIVDIYDDSGTHLTRATAVEQRTGLGHEKVQRPLRRLNSEPSFFEEVVDASGGQILMVGPPTADALRVAGAWPSPEQLLQRLISALKTAADDDTRADCGCQPNRFQAAQSDWKAARRPTAALPAYAAC